MSISYKKQRDKPRLQINPNKIKTQVMKNPKLVLLLLISSVVSLSVQSCSSSNSQENTKAEITSPKEETKTPEVEAAATKPSSVEPEKESSEDSDIQFIRDKYAIITNATNYKVDSITVDCEHGTSTIERRSTDEGELRYLLENSCGDHGCATNRHYFWDNKLIFIFRQNYYYAGNSDYLQEHRTYFKNDKMFRCLEKNVSTDKGYEELKKILQKTANQTIDCAPNKRTGNLQQMIDLDLTKAKDFLCD